MIIIKKKSSTLKTKVLETGGHDTNISQKLGSILLKATLNLRVITPCTEFLVGKPTVIPYLVGKTIFILKL